jgi:hypothetical protein
MAKASKDKGLSPALAELIKRLRALPPVGGVEKKFVGGEKKFDGDSRQPSGSRQPRADERFLAEAREVLMMVAGHNETRDAPAPGLRLAAVRGELVVGEGGRVSVEYPSPLVPALVGAEARRVRRCRVCGNIFYARRDEQVACDKKCMAAYRGRRWRARKHEAAGGADSEKILKGVLRKKRASRETEPDKPARKRGARPTSGTGKASGQGREMLSEEFWRERKKKGGW